MASVETARGPVPVEKLGATLMHEHIFIRNPELEINYPNETWTGTDFISLARDKFRQLKDRGIDSLVDLTVLGLGPDIRLIQAVLAKLDFEFNIILATGYYTYKDVAPYFRMHGPGRRVDEPEPLDRMFLRDIQQGIGGTTIKAALIKIATDEYGFTTDLERVFAAAARVQLQTGVPITTHTSAKKKGGLDQQAFLKKHGADLTNVIIGHCGDSNDLDYLQEVADQGSIVGMDRFGIDSYNSGENRIATVAAMCKRGYADRMILSHDAAVFSINTEPQHRAKIFPNWHYNYVSDDVIPALRDLGVTEAQIRQMMVENPKRILAPRR
ncbi:phosphotriesterase family protein [Falsiroseomonas sp. HW251]|uniref:phosphotriesterase family protein n=1 Tax=Falsiroseomonas sp. HW251 TaxID=3390998 RepID=UPI003D31E339